MIPARTARVVRAIVVLALTAPSLLAGCGTAPPPVNEPASPPLEYRAPFTSAIPNLNMGLESGAWAAAPWTTDFVDIVGPAKPTPAYRTRAKMLWDQQYLYVAAELQEPNLWHTLTQRDQIIFHDNDFEVFIDPNGDGAEYYEIEVNQHPAIFDLYLHRMYREGGPAIHEWDCVGMRTELMLAGSGNDPRRADKSWMVQLSIPWSSLRPPSAHVSKEAAAIAAAPSRGEAARAAAAPKPGETWRINFSRVQWRNNHEALDSSHARVAGAGAIESPEPYAKVPNLPEDNWVWSPQWTVDMHLPQFWGRVTFVR